jgi:hypothetical protein
MPLFDGDSLVANPAVMPLPCRTAENSANSLWHSPPTIVATCTPEKSGWRRNHVPADEGGRMILSLEL